MINRLGLLLFLATTSIEADEPAHGKFPEKKIEVGDKVRVYRLYVPKSVDLDEPSPLVIAFHGMLIDSKDVMPRHTKLDELASKKEFLIAYPAAIDRSWGLSPDKVKSDLKFFDALVEEISEEYQIDENRIYVVGMSNGGYFAHLVGKERSTRVAAVVSHSGPLGLQTLLGIKAKRKFPVMILHGDKDPLFDISIARENRDKYRKEKHEVEYLELKGHRHSWDTKSNEKIWEFLEKYPLKKKKRS